MICLYVAAADSRVESAIAGLISDCVEVERSGSCLYGAEDIVAITGAEDIVAIAGAEVIGVEVVEVVVAVVTERIVVEWSGF